MKIGFIIYGSINTLSGGYMYDRKLVEYLQVQGDTVEIISLPWRYYGAHLADNLSFRLPSNFDIFIQDELNHPSLINANSGRHPCPIISLVHHLRCSELRPKWQNDLYRIVEKKYLQSVDGYIFNSKTTMGVVDGLINHGKPSMVAYPPTDRFGDAISEKEIETRAQSEPLKIIFLGNIIGRKGLFTLLQAVNNQKSKVVVNIVGSLTSEPAYTKKIQSFISENNLSSSIYLHGPLDNEPLIQKLKQAHMLIVPSSYEGFGIVYLEGMGFGLPAIGTTAGAAGEIIEDGKTGYLIKPNDHQSLATHISQLASDRNLLTKISINARNRYTQQPSWSKTAGEIRKFLQSML
ncbi:glycosyltransferase family 4 protein [Candidatus Villigracilis saccharophilus]|uniref:glycosyltransferase family 4 protein n=1 Tax=Candidatus Villigracilis saccharophilus TaxID=3140684 RepID=UPI003136912A|nr:glycosyltransferase family 4 protein [Anaerolineales bacterium]